MLKMSKLIMDVVYKEELDSKKLFSGLSDESKQG